MKTNIATTRDQSARLLQCGVPAESAEHLASRLTAEEKERVRKEYANTHPNDIDCGVENILIQGVLERIFGSDFFKEEE